MNRHTYLLIGFLLFTACSHQHMHAAATSTGSSKASPAEPPSVAPFHGSAELIDVQPLADPAPHSTTDEPSFADRHLPVDHHSSATSIPEYGLLYFAFDSWWLIEENRRFLDRLADQVRSASVDLLIEGHADVRGTQAYNFVLGHRRAMAVKRYLVDLGIPASRLFTKSYGELAPTCTLDDEIRCHRYNRRTFLLIQEPRHARSLTPPAPY